MSIVGSKQWENIYRKFQRGEGLVNSQQFADGCTPQPAVFCVCVKCIFKNRLNVGSIVGLKRFSRQIKNNKKQELTRSRERSVVLFCRPWHISCRVSGFM